MLTAETPQYCQTPRQTAKKRSMRRKYRAKCRNYGAPTQGGIDLKSSEAFEAVRSAKAARLAQIVRQGLAAKEAGNTPLLYRLRAEWCRVKRWQ